MSFLLPNTPSLADQLKLSPAKKETKTVATMMARTDNDPFTQQDVKKAAGEAMAANAQHQGRATTTMMRADKVHAESEQERKQFREAGQQQVQAVKDKGTLLMAETRAKVDANQQAYKEFNDTVGSEEWSTSRTMMMKEMAARQQDLATAHNDLQNGGFLDSIGAAFRVAYHQERLNDLSQSVSQIQVAEMNAGQQLLTNLQKNAAAVGDIYAIEKQQNLNKAELAATLMKMSADGIQLNRDSMAEMASILGISSDVANAKMKDFNVIIAANNASSSIFQTKLQELQAEQAQMNLDRSKKLYADEESADKWIQKQWEQFTTIHGVKDAGTFKQAEQLAMATKQPSPMFTQFGLWIGTNKDKFSLADAVTAKKGNGPLSDAQSFALQRGEMATAELNREIAAKNKALAMEKYPPPMVDGKPVTQGFGDANGKARAEYEAQLNAQSLLSTDNPEHIGRIQQHMKKMDAEFQANKAVAYNTGTIQDSPVEDVNALAKTAGPVRDLLASKLSPEVMAKLEKGEFSDVSTTIEAGKDAGTEVFNKLMYATKSSAQKSRAQMEAGGGAETVESMKARLQEQAQVVAAGWAAKVQASPDYRNQEFTDARMLVPVPAADGSATSEMVEIDMTNPSAVYYYMEQLAGKEIVDILHQSKVSGAFKGAFANGGR